MVDLFAGMVSGAAYLTHVQAWDKNPGIAQNLGHFFMAIDATKLAGSALGQRMADFRGILTSTPAADPAAPVIAPGDRELAAYKRAQREGVRVATADLKDVEKLAGM
jgi:LDH2 family malate/lactate/ureidoglycolate dehydrogenase